MKLKSLPKELMVEILDYLADYEHFEGLDQVLEGEYTLLEVRSALHELSIHLRKELEQERSEKSLPDHQKDAFLSPTAKRVLSVLSPGDERRLLTRFGLMED